MQPQREKIKEGNLTGLLKKRKKKKGVQLLCSSLNKYPIVNLFQLEGGVTPKDMFTLKKQRTNILGGIPPDLTPERSFLSSLLISPANANPKERCITPHRLQALKEFKFQN